MQKINTPNTKTNIEKETDTKPADKTVLHDLDDYIYKDDNVKYQSER